MFDYVCVCFISAYCVIFNCLFSILFCVKQFRVCVERLFTAVRLNKLCLFLSSFILRVCVCVYFLTTLLRLLPVVARIGFSAEVVVVIRVVAAVIAMVDGSAVVVEVLLFTTATPLLSSVLVYKSKSPMVKRVPAASDCCGGKSGLTTSSSSIISLVDAVVSFRRIEPW